jgi:4-hydroxybenzoate polyprenyltransferase
MRALNFIFSRSIFVSFCAAFLSVQTFILTKVQLQMSIVILVFFLTLFFYNLYAIIIKWQVDIGSKNPIVLPKYAANFFLVLVSIIYVSDSFFKSPQLIRIILIPGFTSVIYLGLMINKGKFFIINKLGFLKTILLSFTWAYTTVILPSLATQNEVSQLSTQVFSMRFVFMLILGIIFDFRDVQKDRKNNWSSVATMFNKNQLIGVMLMLLLLNSVLCYWNLKIVGEIQQFILLMSTVLAFLFFIISLNKRNYYFYYFLVDGLMLFSAIASIIATL